jgi:hypothetical protein
MIFRSPNGRRHSGERDAQFARVSGAVVRGVGLRLRGVEHHVIDQDPGNLDVTRRQRAAFGEPLHLHDDEAAGAPRRLRARQHLAGNRLLLHGDVAVLVRGGAAQKDDVERQRLEAQPFLAVDRHQLDEILLGARALAPAELARIDEGVQPGLGDEAGAAARHLPHQLRQHALRQRVGLDLVVAGEVDQHRRVDQRAGHAALEHARVGKARGALLRPVADADHMDQTKIARLPFVQEALLDRRQDRFRNRMPAARPADQNIVTGPNQLGGLRCADDFHLARPRDVGPLTFAGVRRNRLHLY